jgi:hypothetical protein
MNLIDETKLLTLKAKSNKELDYSVHFEEEIARLKEGIREACC